jgi:hypothetical protein
MSVNCTIKKMELYISLMEATPIYWSAMIVHPGFRPSG